MSLKNRSITATLWSTAQGTGGQIIGLVMFTVLARLLDPEAFGLIALAAVYITFIQVFVEQGFEAAIVQRHDLEPEHLDTAFWTNLGFGVLLCALTWFLSGFFADLFKQPDLKPIIQWLSLSLIFYSLSTVQVAILKRELRFKPLAVRALTSTLLSGLIGITLAMMGYGVWSLVAQQLSNALIQLVMLWTTSSWRPALRFSPAHFKHLFGFSANVLGINILEFVNRNADNLLIGYFLGPIALGYYALAYKLFQTLTLILTGATSQVAFSSFSTLQTEPQRMRSAFYTAVAITALIAFPVHMGTFAIAGEILPFVFGDQWDNSITALQVLCFAGILESVYFFNASVMMAMGKPQWRLRINLLASVLNVIGFAIAIYFWGTITAVACAYAIRGYLLSPIPIFLVRRLIKIEYKEYIRVIGVPMIAALSMVIFIMLTKQSPIAETGTLLPIMLYIVVGAFAYVASIFTLDRSRLTTLWDLVRSIRKR